MLLYKYRGCEDDKIFKRDLNSIVKNCIWSSSVQKLNDPCETIFSSNSFKKQSKFLFSFFGKQKYEHILNIHSLLDDLESLSKKIGVYSLSKTYNDELLWAHYGNSHKGFCIEYDFEKLFSSFDSKEDFSFPVIYSKNPPKISYQDMSIKHNKLAQKITGYKSKRWKYENEHRIITNSYGDQTYNFEALKSIYFGLNMNEEQKNTIFLELKDRGINYYQIHQIEKSYNFERELIKNPYYTGNTYLKQIPSSITNSNPVPYKILEKHFDKFLEKGIIYIELETKILKKEIEWLANIICDQIFHTAKIVAIYYYYKSQINRDSVWATSHKIEGKIEILIKDYLSFD